MTTDYEITGVTISYTDHLAVVSYVEDGEEKQLQIKDIVIPSTVNEDGTINVGSSNLIFQNYFSLVSADPNLIEKTKEFLDSNPDLFNQ